jgi:hypothetical protein
MSCSSSCPGRVLNHDADAVLRLYYLLKYPPSSSPVDLAEEATERDALLPKPGQGQGYDDLERPKADEKDRIQVAGAFVLCPMVEGRSSASGQMSLPRSGADVVSKNSRPHILVEYIARAIVYFAGMLPLAKAVRGEFERSTLVP